MEKFELPENNVFEEKARTFFKSKRARQLQRKYQVKPFDERFSILYYCSIVVSYFANGLSALTASTWVFTYVYSIVKELPYPSVHAGFWTGILLLLLELLQRFLATDFFKTRLQFGYTPNTRRTLNAMLLCMILLSGISIISSSLGGFDLVDLVTSKPMYETPTLENRKEVEQRYTKLVNQAKDEAEDYKQRKLYMGRLSDKHARHYRNLLDRKNNLADSLLVALNRVDAENKKRTTAAKKEFMTVLSVHENEIENRGTGLAGATIFFIGLFFISIWFREYYDYRTALLYAQHSPSPTPPQKSEGNNEISLPKINKNQDIELFKQLEMLQKKIEKLEEEKAKTTFTDLTNIDNNGLQNGQSHKNINDTTLPIGFFSREERQEQQQNLFKQPQEVFKQTFVQNEVIYHDKYTVAHKDLKTGEIKHLNLDSINNRIGIYQTRIQEAKQIEDKKVLKRREKRLTYWQGRKDELLSKITE